MEGYRGYFYFQDVLTDYAASSSEVKVSFCIDGETGIEEIQTSKSANIQDDQVFDLSGRRVEKVSKGIYIINNKKVVVK